MKKIMAVIAAAAVALTLVGCANFGAKTSGTKWKKTFKLDATDTEKLKDADGTEANYARGFAALSTSKKCNYIETTITLPAKEKDKAANIFTASGVSPAVIGLAIDVHETTVNNKKYYDFVLVGVRPSSGEFYVEKYENIAKDDLKESMITNDSAIGGAKSNAASGAAKWTSLDGKGSASFVSGKTVKIDTNADGDKSFTITVTQDTAGTYVIKNGTTKLGEYTRALTDAEKASTAKLAYGQIFMYGNAPKGTKLTAKFDSNKDATKGLFADEDEE